MQSSEIMNIPMIDNAKVMSKGQMKKVSHTINIKKRKSVDFLFLFCYNVKHKHN